MINNFFRKVSWEFKGKEGTHLIEVDEPVVHRLWSVLRRTGDDPFHIPRVAALLPIHYCQHRPHLLGHHLGTIEGGGEGGGEVPVHGDVELEIRRGEVRRSRCSSLWPRDGLLPKVEAVHGRTWAFAPAG